MSLQACAAANAHVALAAVKPHLPALLACLREAPDCALSCSSGWLRPLVAAAATRISDEAAAPSPDIGLCPADAKDRKVTRAAPYKTGCVCVSIIAVRASHAHSRVSTHVSRENPFCVGDACKRGP